MTVRNITRKRIRNSIVFGMVAVALFAAANFIMRPVWLEWNNYNTTYGFYEEPKDTIEVIFLGASTVVNGIVPMELYEDYDICGYNLGTEQQPLLASYYWMEEAYRLHGKTLNTVVLDVSMLRRELDEVFYRKALEAMPLSEVKFRAFMKCSQDAIEMTRYLFPVLSYHERWKKLVDRDFLGRKNSLELYTRGYNFTTNSRVNQVVEGAVEVAVPEYAVDAKAEETELNAEAMLCLQRIVRFCEEHDLELILMKTPVSGSWTSSDHNAVENVAVKYGVEFYDFNFEPLLDEIQYHYIADSTDGIHMNYYGAKNLTRWFGELLSRKAEDDSAKFSMPLIQEELANYKRSIISVKLGELVTPEEYIEYLMEQDDYVLFITVKDDAATALTSEQRSAFASLGLRMLADIGYRDSYLACVGEGIPVEIIREGEEGEENVSSISQKNTENALEYELDLQDGTRVSLTSGGFYMGNISSCVIDKTEYSLNERGLNVVVYDKRLHKVVDAAFFDTCMNPKRTRTYAKEELAASMEEEKRFSELTADEQVLYKYDRVCQNAKVNMELEQSIDEAGLLSYLQVYWKEADDVVFISAADDAAGSLTDPVRKALADMGLEQLANLEYRDSYLAVIMGGEVLTEERDHGNEPIEIKGIDYVLASGGHEAGNVSSIQIGENEYSVGCRGLNIVVYDKILEKVVSRRSFDTCGIPQELPAGDLADMAS